MQGRTAIPTRLKQLRGNPGKQRLNHNEPQPAPTSAEPPEGLSPEEAAYWARHVPELIRIGCITAVDRDEFALGCRLRIFGLKYLYSQNRMEVTKALHALKQSSLIFGRFGIGASDRSRIVAVPAKPSSKWTGLVNAS